jgi:hypothetical protein
MRKVGKRRFCFLSREEARRAYRALSDDRNRYRLFKVTLWNQLFFVWARDRTDAISRIAESLGVRTYRLEIE